MKSIVIIQEVDEVDARLASLKMDKPSLTRVVQEAVLARNNATSNDAANAAGSFAYFSGTRALRNIFRPEGWELNRDDSIESIYKKDIGIKVVYQNVDRAAEIAHIPKARSKKGPGSKRAVENNQLLLFPETVGYADSAESSPAIWYLCVSADGSEVHAELSLPMSLKDGQFEGFIERIFILEGGEFEDFSIIDTDDEGNQDFEVNVARK